MNLTMLKIAFVAPTASILSGDSFLGFIARSIEEPQQAEP